MRIRHLGALLPLLAVMVAGPLVAQQVAPASYGLKPGDRLTISFYTSAGDEVGEIDGDRTIARDGAIFLPFLGTVGVEGMDAPAIRDMLVTLYAPYFEDPVIDVEARLRVSVTGAVARPGNFFVDPTTTLIDLLAEAGGANEIAPVIDRVFADPSQARLVRRGEVIIVDIRADAPNPQLAAIPVESGDWLYIPYSERSRLREQISFWGQIISVITSIAILVNVTS
jgi:protein involved in polysaccharide export with SLBB domain